MKRFLISMLAIACLATACSSDDEPIIPESGVGHIEFNCLANSEIGDVITRTEQPTFNLATAGVTIPDPANLILTINGSYTKNGMVTPWSWPTASGEAQPADDEIIVAPKTVADFESENPAIEAGAYDVEQKKYLNSYEAAVTYGDPNAEGENCPYFMGKSASFSVYPGETKEVTFSATLANSCFNLSVTEWMLKYYDNIELTIHTANNEFTFALNETTAISSLIFVKSGQQLSFSGSAVKSQTGTTVEFPETPIGVQLDANTHYNIVVNHDTAGGGNLQIMFGDTFVEVEPVEVELNPDVNGNGNSGNGENTDDPVGEDDADGEGNNTQTPDGN